MLGEELEAFEAEFASFCGARFCAGVANGLEALVLILRAYGIGPGDEVLVPSNTFIATWLAVTHGGAVPVPVEPLEHTFNIDPNRDRLGRHSTDAGSDCRASLRASGRNGIDCRRCRPPWLACD